MTHKKQITNCSMNDHQQGFTLVEFMVASVLGLVVIAGAGALYSYTKRLNDIGRTRVAVLQDLRSAAALIGQDARSAGTFGCASLGRRYAPDSDPKEATIGLTIVEKDPAAPKLKDKYAGLTTLEDATNPAAGVRWVKEADVAAALNNPANFAAKSGAILFYYGEGSLPWKNTSDIATVKFELDEASPNRVVESIYQNGGYVVAAGCNALQVEYVKKGTTEATIALDGDAKVVAAAFENSGVTAPAGITLIDQNQDMILQRYKVVAYVVGDIAGEPTSLYRFEFGANGDEWSAPQQLAKNVTNMTAEYLFVTDCPSGLVATGTSTTAAATASWNTQNYELKDAEDGDVKLDPTYNGNQGPTSVHLTLTYNFPNIRGGSVLTGAVDATKGGPKDETFDIVTTVRGGNVCASRKLAYQ